MCCPTQTQARCPSPCILAASRFEVAVIAVAATLAALGTVSVTFYFILSLIQKEHGLGFGGLVSRFKACLDIIRLEEDLMMPCVSCSNDWTFSSSHSINMKTLPPRHSTPVPKQSRFWENPQKGQLHLKSFDWGQFLRRQGRQAWTPQRL